jgi:hypothetical protein
MQPPVEQGRTRLVLAHGARSVFIFFEQPQWLVVWLHPTTVRLIPTTVLVHPTNTTTLIFSTLAARDEPHSWPSDPFRPSNPSPTSVRPDRPRVIAPAYKWEALPSLIQTNSYHNNWNNTIFGNAQTYYDQPVKQYFVDGGNGVLDIAREIKMRIKAWAYAYRVTKDIKWVDRSWMELQVCRKGFP